MNKQKGKKEKKRWKGKTSFDVRIQQNFVVLSDFDYHHLLILLMFRY